MKGLRMTLMKKLSFIVLFLALSQISARAEERALAGVSFPTKIQVGETTLHLNGLGLRKATIFGIRVYVGGLYLPNATNDADGILRSKEPMRLVMHFVREVDAKRIRDGWQEGFESNYPAHKTIQAAIDALKAITPDMREGDQIAFDIVGDEVTVSAKNKVTQTISAQNFGRALLSVWLGPNPPNESLKKGLLGQE